MITIVDKVDGFEIQKITKPDGKLVRYQVVQLPAGDSEQVRVFMALEMARAAIGKTKSGKVAEVVS